MNATPESFAKYLASIITPDLHKAMAQEIKQSLKEAPKKTYDVVRQPIVGPPVRQQTDLAQLMAELTDQLRISSEVGNRMMMSNNALMESVRDLVGELKEQRKFAKKLASQREDDEDDE